MKIEPLAFDGAFSVTPRIHGDARGSFLEWYRPDRLAEALGVAVMPRQGNLSVSRRGVVRGIHFASVPPGQAKYVTCVAGAVLDVFVDLRVGSPTFGSWSSLRLDDEHRRAVYLADGLGHGFCALTDPATVMYLTSTAYDPGSEHAVDPLDPDLGIAWPVDRPLLSTRDEAAPGLREVLDAGLLPPYRALPAAG